MSEKILCHKNFTCSSFTLMYLQYRRGNESGSKKTISPRAIFWTVDRIKCTQKLLEIWLKIEKYQFYDLCFFDVVVKKIHQFFQNRKIDNFMFLTISLVFFQIKRCSKWHFNPLNNSFLPLEEKFTPGLIFFELLKAPKNTLLWPFQVNFNGIWTAIWTL